MMRCNSYFPILSRPSIILLRFGILFVTLFVPSGTSEYRWHTCNNGSLYYSNLHRVTEDLLSRITQTGFDTSSHGQPPNKVYGLLQCFGNISAEDCSNCSQQAIANLQVLCGNDTGGLVWMDNCFLRVDGFNFISILDTDDYGIMENTQDIKSNIDGLRSKTYGLLSSLSDQAYNPANKGFAAGSTSYSSTADEVPREVYGLVQCWGDISLQDCRRCLSDALLGVKSCCSTKQGVQIMFGSCTLRYEIYPFFVAGTTTSEGSISPTVEPIPAEKPSKNLPKILGSMGSVILLLFICLFVMRGKLRAVISSMRVNQVTENDGRDFAAESGLHEPQHRLVLKLQTLIEATQNFDDDNKLGEGGFGTVYKGTTQDGKMIAVKKLSAKSKQGKQEFMNEVKLVANVQHRNLVKLLGCCAEGNERFLVYEYLPNKSLDGFIFDPDKRVQLDWSKRYNIIIGVARGLLYLHQDSELRIIHRDIKASNILLDEKLKPKIADFGLARLFPEDATHIQTKVAGTRGYMAPEYAMGGQLSLKADVYSFGVLILEIVSGRKNIEIHLPQEMQSILQWAWRLCKRGNALEMVDSTLMETCVHEQALRLIRIGLLCTQAEAALRPAMSKLIVMLSSNSVTLPEATKPAYVCISQGSGSTTRVRKSGSPLFASEESDTS